MTASDFSSVTQNGALCDDAGGLGPREFEAVIREQAGDAPTDRERQGLANRGGVAGKELAIAGQRMVEWGGVGLSGGWGLVVGVGVWGAGAGWS